MQRFLVLAAFAFLNSWGYANDKFASSIEGERIICTDQFLNTLETNGEKEVLPFTPVESFEMAHRKQQAAHVIIKMEPAGTSSPNN